jgi:hypothetical protein
LAITSPNSHSIQHFIVHAETDITPPRKKRKTYGRLFGMIFWEGVGATLVVERQWLATVKTQRNRENAKKSVK